MRVSLIVLLAVLAAAPAASADRPSQDAQFYELIEGRTAGKPVRCVNRRGETGFNAVGSRLVFRYGSTLSYVNETRGSCQGPGKNEALVVRSTGTYLCSGDLVRVVDPRTGTDWGACTLGRFVPYRK